MGKADNKGRRDKDKYYHLAKEQGYRARSAYKLIQMNASSKGGFLADAKVLVDLCAAPGGWLQVAAKYMPSGSTIIGIDLAPIKPIRGVITHVEDITTPACRAVLKRDMGKKRADVVLHDGAPNVGSNWDKDAFGQNELALSALALATDVLRRGGLFITKIFRSADYNSLLWVFHQLFERVEATKPHSSRDQSAEIFVVCRDYKAPDKLDPRLLDARYVFKETDDLVGSATGVAGGGGGKAVDVFHKKAGERKRERQGYDESLGPTLTRPIPVSQFLRTLDPVRMLTQASLFTWDEEAVGAGVAALPGTTPDIKEAFKDLKLLGKAEFKSLLKWRTAVRGAVSAYGGDGKSVASKKGEGEGEEDVEEDEKEEGDEEEDEEEAAEDAIVAEAEKDLAAAAAQELRRRKKEEKREKKARALALRRFRLGLNRSSVDMVEQGGEGLMDTKTYAAMLKSGKIDAFAEGEDWGDDEEDEDEDEEDEEGGGRRGGGGAGWVEEDEAEPFGGRGRGVSTKPLPLSADNILSQTLDDERGAEIDDMEESLEISYANTLARREVAERRARAIADSGRVSHGIKLTRREKLQHQATLSEAAMNNKLDSEHTRYLAMLAGARSGLDSMELLAPAARAAAAREEAASRMAGDDEEEEEEEESEGEGEGEGESDEDEEEGEEDGDDESEEGGGGGGGGKQKKQQPAMEEFSTGRVISKKAADRWFSTLPVATTITTTASASSAPGAHLTSAALLSLADPSIATAATSGRGGGGRGGKGGAAAAAAAADAAGGSLLPPAPKGKVTFTEDSDAEDEFPEWLADIPKSDREKRKDKLRKEREKKAKVAAKAARMVMDGGELSLGGGKKGGKGGRKGDTGVDTTLKTFDVVAGDEAADAWDADAEFNAVLAQMGDKKALVSKGGKGGGGGGGKRKRDGEEEEEEGEGEGVGVGGRAGGGGELDAKERRKRDLIRAGMGKVAGGGGGMDVDEGSGFDTVPQQDTTGGDGEDSDEDSGSGTDEDDETPDPRDGDYDSDEHAELLALGKLLKKHTTRAKLLDASYNRYSFADDPATLPQWFAADERQHFRPQLPVSKAQVDAIKARFRDIAARPIAKVAEARARKKRRLGVAMDKAKKTATNVMETEELGARAKAKAIAKAYRQAEAKTVGSKYVVSTANGGKKGPKGAAGKRGGKVKLVDPRMKKEKRAKKRATKKATGGGRRK